MPSVTGPVEPFDYIVFGATGDLTMRKLLPALYYRFRDGQMPAEARIIGAARSQLSDEDFRSRAEKALARFIKAPDLDEDVARRFIGQIFFASVNGAEIDGTWDNLLRLFDDSVASRTRVFYLATSPSLYGAICHNLARHGLVSPQSRVVLEKPIGTDLASAERINNEVGQVFEEKKIFRIDHYLGKETVQNLIALRFANPVFERLWSADAIDHVQITAAETVGIEGRGDYYDSSGALRDMIQNHLLQVMCLVAMEPPSRARRRQPAQREAQGAAGPEADPAGRCAERRHSRPVWARAYRRRGRPRLHGGARRRPAEQDRDLRGPEGRDPHLALGQGAVLPALGQAAADQIQRDRRAVQGDAPWSIFKSKLQSNRLIIRLQPQEGIQLSIMSKDPGPDGMVLRPANIDISFEKAFSTRYPDAYERLLMDTVRGDPVLFMRRDEVEAAWTWVEPVLEGWAQHPETLHYYTAGSWGPDAARRLLLQDGRCWHEEVD